MCLNIREGVDLAKEFASRPMEGSHAALPTAAQFKWEPRSNHHPPYSSTRLFLLVALALVAAQFLLGHLKTPILQLHLTCLSTFQWALN
jgi:hypothetical protein